jgi:uncharacterized membrane protein YeiH
MQLLLEHFAVFVSSVSGVLAARGKQVDLFGVIVLAIVTSFGGGTVRDLLLGDTPVVWMKDPNYLINALLAALATFFVSRLFASLRRELLIADAFALALFTIIGAKKALSFNLSPEIAITLGVVTGVAGGILRDVLTGEIPLVFRPHIYLYATAAMAGAMVFVFLTKKLPNEQWNMIIGVAVILALRLAAIRWKVGLPVFDPKES